MYLYSAYLEVVISFVLNALYLWEYFLASCKLQKHRTSKTNLDRYELEYYYEYEIENEQRVYVAMAVIKVQITGLQICNVFCKLFTTSCEYLLVEFLLYYVLLFHTYCYFIELTKGLDGRDGIPGEPGLDGVPGAFKLLLIEFNIEDVDWKGKGWKAMLSSKKIAEKFVRIGFSFCSLFRVEIFWRWCDRRGFTITDYPEAGSILYAQQASFWVTIYGKTVKINQIH